MRIRLTVVVQVMFKQVTETQVIRLICLGLTLRLLEIDVRLVQIIISVNSDKR